MVFFIQTRRLGGTAFLVPGRVPLVIILLVMCMSIGSVPSPFAQNTVNVLPASSSPLRDIVSSGRMPDLRWPDFSDYRTHVVNFYAPTAYALAWFRNNQPTQQAEDTIRVLKRADIKGLNAEDYDGSRSAERLAGVRQSPSPQEQARFDAALTVCVMRYISDLRIGRVNPRHFKFNLDVGRKKYNLSRFLREKLVDGVDVEAELDRIEPPFAGYRRTQQALQNYIELMRQGDGEALPVPPKPVEPGGSYEGTPGLIRRLHLLGDLPSAVGDSEGSNVYDGPVVAGVKHFQEHHGMAPDGRLDPQTLKQLNTPLSFRVEQLRLTLERWRWVPYEFTQPPVVVNIPEFRLRAYNEAGQVALVSKVIVGKAYRNQTPVFERDMKFLVFRPYWNVPPGLHRSQIVPAVRKDRNYIASKGFEVTTPQGAVVTSGVITDDILQQLSAGRLLVRQRPGPSNALGLVKLMFPNEYHVYLHSTPAQDLFSQSRRDFSAGCIRVEQVAELVAWVLRDKPEWTLERVRAAMQSGKDNAHVNLSNPIPVLILYGTAVVDDKNQVYFFDDIYGHDAALEKVLARGYPYPQ